MNMEPTTLLDGDELLMLEESFRTNQRRRQSNESVATMMSIMTLEDDDDRSMDLEEMERMLTLEGELEPEPLSPEEDELIASASSALLAASPAGPSSPTERLRSSWAGHHSFPSPAATASPTAAIASNPSGAAGHRASSHELLLSSAASRQWQAIASSPPAPAPTKTRNSPSRDSSHKDSSIARSPTAGTSGGSGAGATTTPQLPAQQLSQEDVLLRRLAASMQRSGETRSRLFLHSSTTTTNTSPSIPSNAGHLEPGGRICQKMTSAKEPLAPVLPAMMLDGQGCMTTMGGKKNQEQGAALPQKCLSAADATTTATTTTTMNRVAPTQSILRLSGFLAGDLKTLTSGLEHSRNMVQRHGSLLARTSGGMGHVGNVAGVGGTTSV